MLNLLTSPSTRRTLRGLAGTLADAVRSVVNPAALVADQAATVEPVEAPDPADVYTEADMPELVVIERAALGYDLAADAARAADRSKRKHRKVLDRLPAGTYGRWLVRRVASSRETPDLVAIRAIFERHNLGPVPMRQVAPTLRVERVDVDEAAEAVAA